MNRMISALSEVAQINPSFSPEGISRDTLVSFVPMSAVSEVTLRVENEVTKRLVEVYKQYTPFRNGDVLIAKITPSFENGKLAVAELSNELGFGTTEFHVVRPIAELLDTRYLFHFLRQDAIKAVGAKRMTGSAGQKRLPAKFIAELQIPLPSLTEQHRIAAILDKVDELRAKRRKALALLDNLVRSVFLQMFGDPIRNEKKWEIHQIADLTDTPLRANPAKSNFDAFQYIDISSVDGEAGKIVSAKTLPAKDAPSRARQLLSLGDIIISTVRPNLRGTALINEEHDQCICSTGFCVLRPKSNIASEYLYYITRLESFTNYVMGVARGASYPAVTDTDIRELRIAVPPVSSQKAFSKFFRKYTSIAENKVKAAGYLEQLFNSLQKEFFEN